MEIKHIQSAYKRYMHIYDYVFGKLFKQGRDLAVKTVNKSASPQARVLEVGVGTGLSLPYYRKDLNVTGIDISQHMLIKAKEKIKKYSLQDSQSLFKMDAERLAFKDHSFDYVIAMYVVSVVPNAQKFLEEITRVCIPSGDVIIVNHFSSNNRLLNTIEKTFSPLQKVLGFKPAFQISPISENPAFELVNHCRVNLLGYWQLLHLKCKNT